MILLWSLYGVMEVITKEADGSRSAIFMVPVKVPSSLAGWKSGSLQTSSLEALVYRDNKRIIYRREQSGGVEGGFIEILLPHRWEKSEGEETPNLFVGGRNLSFEMRNWQRMVKFDLKAID